MYEKFYGLNEKPFNVTPDPRFLYLGEHHQEALAYLIYGIQERKGFVVITGEIGTGKTTLIHTLLERLDPSVRTALIFNPNLTLEDFFLTVFDEFELKALRPTKAYFLIALNNFLLERLKRNENAVLIIDEAQNLPLPILEEIRLLLNLETSKEKLLQIVLSGQPELNQKLNLPELRQLKQRISIRYHIPPLNRKETEEYIKERLRIAGSPNPALFTDRAIDEIFAYAKGVPRLINILGDNALMLGYADDKRTVDHIMVKECVGDLELKRIPPDRRIDALPRTSRNFFRVRAWRLAFMLLVLMGFLGGFLLWNQEMRNDFFFLFPQKYFTLNKSISTPTHPVLVSPPAKSFKDKRHSLKAPLSEGKSGYPHKIPGEIANKEGTPLSDKDSEGEILGEAEPKGLSPQEMTKGEAAVTLKPEKAAEPFPEEPKRASSIETITVKRNDSLTKISLEHYGTAKGEVLGLIQESNPQIKDIDYIEEGWQIILPNIYQGTPVKKLFSVHIGSFDKFSDARALFSHLANEGYEVYLIPVTIPARGHWYRITLGKFEDQKEALEYADHLLASHTFSYAQPVPIAEAEAMEIEKEQKE